MQGRGEGLGEGSATAHLQKVVFLSCIKVFLEVHILSNAYTIFSKIANFTHHLSQEYDDVCWQVADKGRAINSNISSALQLHDDLVILIIHMGS